MKSMLLPSIRKYYCVFFDRARATDGATVHLDDLQTRVLLEFVRIIPIVAVTVPFLPVAAHPILLLEEGLAELDIGLALANLQRKPGRSVPGDVAVVGPDTRVVRLERDGDVAASRQQHAVAAGRVVPFERAVGQVVLVEGPMLLGNHDEVVSVQVDRVRERDEAAADLFVLVTVGGQDDVDPLVFLVVLIDDGVLGRVEGLLLHVIDGWVAEIEPHRQVEDVPSPEVAVWNQIFGLLGFFNRYVVEITLMWLDC